MPKTRTASTRRSCKFYATGGEMGTQEISRNDFMYMLEQHNGLGLTMHVQHGVIDSMELSS